MYFIPGASCAQHPRWLAYARYGYLFVKYFDAAASQPYPDLSGQAEICTDHRMFELETLAGGTHGLWPLAAMVPVFEWRG